MNKNIRILFILHFPPPVHGSSVVGLQIKESKVINAAYDCHYINMGTSATIDEIGKNAFGKITRYISILSQVIKNLFALRPNLCYLAITAQGIGFYKDAIVVLLVKLFGVKLVYHFHNKGVINRQDKFIDNLLYRYVFKNTGIILLSPCLFSDIQKYVSKNAVQYCPNGIKPIEIGTWPKTTNDCPEILFLSHMLEAKGVYVLLDACAILKKRNLPFHCTFIGGKGDITENQFQEKVVANGLKNSVSYIGSKHGHEKESYFSTADIFAFPTYKETFGLVNLEAMQYELPVVSTYEGGIPDVVEDGVTGFLVPQKDSVALAERLELLIKDPELRKKMGSAGRARYEKEYTLEKFEKRMVEILGEVMNCNQ